MGLVASGNGLGTLLLVPFAESLIASHGCRGAYLRVAMVDLVLFAIAGPLIARPPGLIRRPTGTVGPCPQGSAVPTAA